MSTDKVSQVILQYRLDKQSIANLKGDLAAIRRELEATNATAEDVGGAGDVAGDAIRNAFDTATEQRVAAIKLQMEATADQTAQTAKEFDNLRASIKGAVEQQTQAAGGGFLSKVGTFGTSLRALPSTPIPGTGVTTDAIANVLRVIGRLPPVALEAAAAIGIVAVGLAVLSKELEGVKAALAAAIEADNQYYKDVATLTSAQVKLQLDALKTRNEALKTQIAGELQIVEIGKQGVIESFKGIFDAIGFLFGPKIQEALQNIAGNALTGDISANIAKLNKEYETNAILIDRGTEGLKNGDFALQDRNAAEKQLAAINDKLAEAEINRAVSNAQLLRSGSSEQIQNRIDSLLDENAAIVDIIAAGKVSNDELKKLSDRLGENNAELEPLQTNILDVVRAREAETKALEKQKQIQEQSAAAYEKYQNDLGDIQTKHQQGVLAAQDKYNQTLVDIAAKAADQAETLLGKLQDKQQDIARNLEQAEADAATKAASQALDDQIKYQRDEANAARNHQRDLQKILSDAQDRENELILNRDFAGLFNLRRQTTKQLQDSNTSYNQQRNDRLEAFQQETTDRQRHFIEDEQARQIKYQRDLQDAQIQYQREYLQAARNRNDALLKAKQSYDQEQELLGQKFRGELEQRRTAIIAELELIKQSDAQKLALEQQYFAASQNLLRGAGGGSTATKPSPYGYSYQQFAFGGNMAAGQVGVVNDGFPGQRESFNGVPLPGGMGLFMPLTGGQVRGGSPISVNFNISGNNPEQIAAVVDKKIRMTLKQVFNA